MKTSLNKLNNKTMEQKYIRELNPGTPLPDNEIAFDDGTDTAKKTTIANLPVTVPDIAFNDLSDTELPTPSDNDGVYWDDVQQKWINKKSISALGFAEFDYTFNTSNDDTPNEKYIQYNNDDPTLATIMYVNEIDRNGNDMTLFWDEVSTGDWFNLHDRDDVDGRYQRFDVNGAVTKVGDVYHIPISFYSSAGADFNNNFRIRAYVRYVTQTETSNGGWEPYNGDMPGLIEITPGEEDLVFFDVNLTGTYQKGDWVKVSSGAGNNLIYKAKAVYYSQNNTVVTVVGETSVSNPITAVSFSKLASPQGAIIWELPFYDKTRRPENYKKVISNASQQDFTTTEEAIYDIGSEGDGMKITPAKGNMVRLDLIIPFNRDDDAHQLTIYANWKVDGTLQTRKQLTPRTW